MHSTLLDEKITSDLPRLMTLLFGEGNWCYDPVDELYIAPDPHYDGPGFGFVAVHKDGSYFLGVRPDQDLQ